jgi:hypothetical protein
VHLIVYVLEDAGAVQETDELVPEIVPLPGATYQLYVNVSKSGSDAEQVIVETAPVEILVGLAVSDDIVGA